MSTLPSKPPAILQSPNPLGGGINRLEIRNLEQRWYADVYHYMLAITWRRLLGVFFLIYIGTNAVT